MIIVCINPFIHGKNGFVEVSKNLAGYKSLKIILLDCQNDYVKRLNIFDDAVKYFVILATSLSILHNYFDSLNKIIFRSVSVAKIFKYLSKILRSFRVRIFLAYTIKIAKQA